jgi:hypothetical protein
MGYLEEVADEVVLEVEAGEPASRRRCFAPGRPSKTGATLPRGASPRPSWFCLAPHAGRRALAKGSGRPGPRLAGRRRRPSGDLVCRRGFGPVAKAADGAGPLERPAGKRAGEVWPVADAARFHERAAASWRPRRDRGRHRAGRVRRDRVAQRGYLRPEPPGKRR